MPRALFFICLLMVGCSDRDGGSFAGERVDRASWIPTGGQPAVAREHAAVLPLADGRVLISGGFDDAGAPLASSEIFNPAADQWTAAPPLPVARGRSAVAGDAILGGLAAVPRAEADRSLGDAGFAALPSLAQARYDAAAVQFPSGALLVMGGTGVSSPLSSTELSPSGGAWVPGGALFNARTRPTATLLPSGRVLVAGGVGGFGTLAGTELRQPDGGFQVGPAMAIGRVRHTATLLPWGDVLLVGGEGDAGATAELFVAASSTLLPLPGPLQPRAGHTATLLADGRVLVAGGRGATAAELYSPDAGRFEIAGCLIRPRESHAAAPIASGVLLAFGRDDGGVLAHSERFVAGGGLVGGSACTADCQCLSGRCSAGVCCDRACDRGCETCANTGVCRTILTRAVCRPAASDCDVEDVCDGLSPVCPADRVADAGIFCRNGNGVCDPGESCNGASPLCPPDTRSPRGTVCRGAVAACDQPEVCDGDGGPCPADRLAGVATECRPRQGDCDVGDFCSGTSAFCPRDVTVAVGTVCRASNGVCDEAEICTGGPQCAPDRFVHQSVTCGDYMCPGTAAQCRSNCEVNGDCAATAFCDAGTCTPQPPPRKRYVGFGCAQSGGSGLGWMLGGAVALLLAGGRRRRASGRVPEQRRTNQPPPLALRGAAVALLLFSSGARAAKPEAGFFHTGTEGHHGFALRIDALLLKDLLAVPFGGEAGLTLALSERFDLGAWVSIGRYPGARLGVTLHTRDDGERFRPFLQLRGLVHPVPSGVAFGAGLFGGVTAALGPGRLVLGLLLEGYAGPPEFVPAGFYLLFGYQWDVYRGPDPRRRMAVPPPVEPAVVEAPVTPVEADPVLVHPPEPPAPAPPAVVAPPPTAAPESPVDRTRVVTRIQIREQLFFGDKQVNLDAGLKARTVRVAGALKQLVTILKLEVAGHADDFPNDARCVALSQKRAEAVVAALVAAGVAPQLLVAKGYGRSKALVSTVGPARRREKNRRVDFNVLEMTAP